MYEREMALKQIAAQGMVAGGDLANIQMPTIGQNIDRQIQIHKDAILRLEATRKNLDRANLLDLKISDLREAMGY